uniref:Uncharacterized protein n=1 Tax=Ciona savignyi TaxID=51511 RepID=H2Z1N5_CIOSA
MSSSPSATKVTMVTSTKVKSSKGDSSGSDSNSPMKQVTGVSYIQDSVAESALRDLSSSPDRKSNVTKTSIMIRSVEKNPDKPVDDTVKSNEVSITSSPDESELDKNTQELVLEVSEPESDIKVRRTRSL